MGSGDCFRLRGAALTEIHGADHGDRRLAVFEKLLVVERYPERYIGPVLDARPPRHRWR
jgi:hypothetical protein